MQTITKNPIPNEFGANSLQVFITSIIGLFCLFVLIVARDVAMLSADMVLFDSNTAAVVQFPDFFRIYRFFNRYSYI